MSSHRGDGRRKCRRNAPGDPSPAGGTPRAPPPTGRADPGEPVPRARPAPRRTSTRHRPAARPPGPPPQPRLGSPGAGRAVRGLPLPRRLHRLDAHARRGGGDPPRPRDCRAGHRRPEELRSGTTPTWKAGQTGGTATPTHPPTHRRSALAGFDHPKITENHRWIETERPTGGTSDDRTGIGSGGGAAGGHACWAHDERGCARVDVQHHSAAFRLSVQPTHSRLFELRPARSADLPSQSGWAVRLKVPTSRRPGRSEEFGTKRDGGRS